ncbi:ABC transporter permease [Streptomyces phaeochromogenes]|uniref:ABC transporter permease n=1 Tax=Streptomyces phaeochromogenes TaxID=1923 RepID=A0ABZ1HNW4_STRPH|nr:ABC transporter permease [Streptomyces phaeochromogenes]MCX5599498.1 ABC transporter permease [Streptomyces phaeochromogenes]WSD20287.1 ABC transporter permease [Streptomyces phaeochromogenes]WSJ03021.1 ABC transporter permease [Streptomyces phaeochromogenes]
MTVAAAGAATPQTRRRPVGATARNLRSLGVYTLSVLVGIGIWQLLAMSYGSTLVASPRETLAAAEELARDGTLANSVIASGRRILIGWGLGVLVGVPVGLLVGQIKIVRQFLEPYIEFFRFIPPVAFVTLAVVWLGIGESSKVVLIFYTAVFIVTLNTSAGVMAVSESKLRAAASLGASRRQILRGIVLPSTVPHIVTGARLAMGNSFLTIVSAEIVAAQVGLGSLIWTSRNYGRIDWVFVGIITLGILGFVFDRVLRIVASRVLRRYGVKL